MVMYRETPPPEPNFLDVVERILSKLRYANWIEDRLRKVDPETFKLAWPVDMRHAWITQYFGQNPSSYYPMRGHDGLDFGLVTGSSVRASAFREHIRYLLLKTSGYGRHAITEDDDGHKYVYGHLHEFRCNVGDVIMRGQEFALSGGGLEDPYHGYSTGPHLHWEWRPYGVSVGNGYGGAVDQLPYVTFGEVAPTPPPEAKPFAKVRVKNPNNISWCLTVRSKPSRYSTAIRELSPSEEVYLYKIGSTEVWAEVAEEIKGYVAAIYGGKPYVDVIELINGVIPRVVSAVHNPNSPTFGLNVRNKPSMWFTSVIKTLLPNENISLVGIGSNEVWVQIDPFKQEYIAVKYGGKPYVELIEFINNTQVSLKGSLK
jgi:hypothetical protein